MIRVDKKSLQTVLCIVSSQFMSYSVKLIPQWSEYTYNSCSLIAELLHCDTIAVVGKVLCIVSFYELLCDSPKAERFKWGACFYQINKNYWHKSERNSAHQSSHSCYCRYEGLSLHNYLLMGIHLNI